MTKIDVVEGEQLFEMDCTGHFALSLDSPVSGPACAPALNNRESTNVTDINAGPEERAKSLV